MIYITSKYLIPKGYAAMAVFPFIIFRDKRMQRDHVLINHEKIHLRQQAELLILFFYVWYVTEYLLNLLRYGGHAKAYRNISFEREAYTNERDPNYLQRKKPWAFIKFLWT